MGIHPSHHTKRTEYRIQSICGAYASQHVKLPMSASHPATGLRVMKKCCAAGPAKDLTSSFLAHGMQRLMRLTVCYCLHEKAERVLCSAGTAEGDEAAGKGSHAAPACSLQGGSLGRPHCIRPLHSIPPAGAPPGLAKSGPLSWLQLSAACTACYAQRVARCWMSAQDNLRYPHALCSLQAAECTGPNDRLVTYMCW